MPEAVYALCGLTSILCAFLLLRGWRHSRARLLFWAGLCFCGLALDNVVVFIDYVTTPQSITLFWWQIPPALAGMLLLIYGLIREAK